MAGAIPRGEESGFPFLSRTRFSPETWYENETIYTAGTPYTSARTKYHDRGTKSLFGTGVRSHVRHRGDRLRAQIDGPAQPPFRAQAVQRTARGHGDLPELPREDAEGVRGGRDRGAKGPPGPARGGRVPPLAERAGPVRGDPRPGGMGDAMGHGGRISRGDAMSQFANTNTRDVTFRREREPAEGRDPARCPDCGSFALYVDPVAGARVCDSCGFVVDEALVDQGPDWTTFEGDDRIRAGPPPSVMAPDKGLGSMVGNGLRDAKGNPIDARSVAALNRLRRVSRWTRYDRTERALAPGLAQLSSLSSRLGLAPAFRERAAIILRKAIEAGLSRGRSMDAIVAAVVYLASEELGVPFTQAQIARLTGVSEVTIRKHYRLLKESLAEKEKPLEAA